MKLKQALPANRTFEQIFNRYLVERSIAKRLKEFCREERKQIYKTMYEELFNKVPDHPRLTRKNVEQLTTQANFEKYKLVSEFLDKSTTFAEFAPGDCKFAYKVAKYVYGIDISDQSDTIDHKPENFKLIVYNGYELSEQLY